MTYQVEIDHPEDGWMHVGSFKTLAGATGAMARACTKHFNYKPYGYFAASEPRSTYVNAGTVVAVQKRDHKVLARVWR